MQASKSIKDLTSAFEKKDDKPVGPALGSLKASRAASSKMAAQGSSKSVTVEKPQTPSTTGDGMPREKSLKERMAEYDRSASASATPVETARSASKSDKQSVATKNAEELPQTKSIRDRLAELQGVKDTETQKT